MKKIIVMLVICSFFLGIIPVTNENVSAAWYDNHWGYYMPITIDKDLIDNTLINFPLLVVIDSTVGAFCDGGDSIRFVNNTDNTTEYNYEIERWQGGSGDSFVWVNVTKVDSSVDTKVLMYYNYSSATDNQDASNVWDANYVAVYHMENTSDSTGNNRHLTAYNNPTLSSGKIGRCYSFDAGDDEYMNNSNFYDFDDTKNASIEVWANHYGFGPSSSTRTGIHWQDDPLNNYGFRMATITSGDRRWAGVVKNTVNNIQTYTAVYQTNTYHHLSANYTEDEVNIFFNGTNVDTDTGNTDWTLFPTSRLEIARNQNQDPNFYHGEFDEIRFSNIRRNASYLKASFHSGNQSSQFITYGTPVSNPASGVPLEPTDFTVTTLGYASIKLDWTQGVDATHTIIRSDTSGYPATVFSGTLVCNSTGTTFTDIDLNPNIRYYYRAWSYSDVLLNYSFLYNESWNHTGPSIPTGVIGTPDGSDLDFNWTQGRDASHTVLVRKVGSFPTTIADGTVVYNNTGLTYTDNNVLQTWRYSIWAYNDTTNLYSSRVTAPWGALDVNCYNEDTLDGINFNILVTTDDGSEIYSANNCTNTYRISVGDLPVGAVGIHISGADFYNNQSEIFTGYPSSQYKNTTYIQLQYTPNSKTETNVTCYDSGGSNEYYPSFVLTEDVITIYPDASSSFDQVNVTYIADFYGHRWYYRTIIANTMFTLDSYLPPSSLKQLYIISVVDELDNPVKDAYVVVRRELGGSYVNVSNFYSNGYGQGSVYLIPDEPYKFVISKSGYETEYSDWTPSTSAEGHIFQLEHSAPTEPTEYLFINVIEFTANAYRNGSINIQYSDSSSLTTDTQFYLYESYDFTDTRIDAETRTSENTISYWVTGLNMTRMHYVHLTFNHSYTFYEEQPIKILIYPVNRTANETQQTFEAHFVAVLGENELGWGNCIACAIAVILLVSFSPFNAGIGVISAGVSLVAVETVFYFSRVESLAIIAVIPIVIFLGIFYILATRQPEAHL